MSKPAERTKRLHTRNLCLGIAIMVLFSSQGFVDRAVAVYRECAKASSVTKSRVSLLNHDSKSGTVELNITSKWSQRDLERDENRSFDRNHTASYEISAKSFSNIREPSFPVEVQNL